jgi:hypothetical protein
MLYENPQFVTAVKKIIRDLLGSSKPSVESEQAQQNPGDERNDAPIVTVSELRTQVPIRVKTKADESDAERIWKWAKGILEVFGILAVIVYTILAQQSLELSKANSRLDQRAWIGMQSTSIIFTLNQPIQVGIEFGNSGKTPAINTYMQNSAGPNLTSIPSLCTDALRKKEARILVAPGGREITTVPISKEVLREGWEKSVPQQQRVYAFGCIVYDDIFSDKEWEHRHWITHCETASMADAKPGVPLLFVACETGNDTGDGPPPSQ